MFPPAAELTGTADAELTGPGAYAAAAKHCRVAISGLASTATKAPTSTTAADCAANAMGLPCRSMARVRCRAASTFDRLRRAVSLPAAERTWGPARALRHVSLAARRRAGG